MLIPAFLAASTALERTRAELGGGPEWIGNLLRGVQKSLAGQKAESLPSARAWLVIEGGAGELLARGSAAKSGAAAVVVARTPIEQSYEPRMVKIR